MKVMLSSVSQHACDTCEHACLPATLVEVAGDGACTQSSQLNRLVLPANDSELNDTAHSCDKGDARINMHANNHT